MTERLQRELADRIEQVLNRGGRHYTLAGAELDWVIKALREPMLAFNSDAYGEKVHKDV